METLSVHWKHIFSLEAYNEKLLVFKKQGSLYIRNIPFGNLILVWEPNDDVSNVCFQYSCSPAFWIPIIFRYMFPNWRYLAFISFQYLIHVSTLESCFQTKMFPMYVSKLYYHFDLWVRLWPLFIHFIPKWFLSFDQ